MGEVDVEVEDVKEREGFSWRREPCWQQSVGTCWGACVAEPIRLSLPLLRVFLLSIGVTIRVPDNSNNKELQRNKADPEAYYSIVTYYAKA